MQRSNQSSKTESRVRAPSVQFKKVLVPVDFSKSSQASVQFAVELARRHDSQLILLNVIEPMIYPASDGFTNFAVVPVSVPRSAVRAKLKRWKETEVPPGMKVDTKLRIGQAYKEIVEAARQMEVDLIIISTHGYSGLKHILVGSTAERVVRHATCPVLTLRSA